MMSRIRFELAGHSLVEFGKCSRIAFSLKADLCIVFTEGGEIRLAS